MTIRVGINGFGRIGRQSLKAIIERAPDVTVVAINDLVDTELNALLFKHDSTYGAYPGTVESTDEALIIDGREIRVLAEKDPAVRRRNHEELRRTAEDPKLARAFLLRSSLIESLREAEQIA